MLEEYKMKINVNELDEDLILSSQFILGEEKNKSILIGSIINSDSDNFFFEPVMSSAFLFTGKIGCGKSFIEKKYVNHAVFKGGYKVYSIPLAEMIAEDKKDFNYFIKEIKNLLLTDSVSRFFFSLGDIDLIIEDKISFYKFVSTVKGLKLLSSRCIFTACCNCEPCDIPSVISDAFEILLFEIPEYNNRKQFFYNNYYPYFCYLDSENAVISEDMFAEQTEGFTYGELRKLGNKITNWCRGCYRCDENPPRTIYDENEGEYVFLGKYMSQEIFDCFIEDVIKERFIIKVPEVHSVPQAVQYSPVVLDNNQNNYNTAFEQKNYSAGVVSENSDTIIDFSIANLINSSEKP